MSKAGDINQIIERCGKDDRHSQSILFEQYAPFVMSVILRYCRDSYESKDICLKTFEKIFRHINKYDSSKGAFKTWIAKIASNESLRSLKVKKRHLYVEDLESVNESIPAEAIMDMDAKYLFDLIGTLSDPYKIIFNMMLDGYSFAEIGKELDIKETTARSYCFRARNMLKKKLHKSQKVSSV